MNDSQTHIFIDLDGTICDTAHRAHLMLAGEFEAYHEALIRDLPFKKMAIALEYLEKHFTLIGITGRPKRFEKLTNQWFQNNRLVYLDEVLMRPDGNFESEPIVKVKLIEEYFGGLDEALWNTLLILDDKDKDVEHLRGVGFTVWQTRHGDF